MNKIEIKAEHLSFDYPNGHSVLKDISFEIEKGSFVCITGSNGSGKSTLLKLVCSILRPNSGHIEVCERFVPLVFQNPDNQFVSNIVEEDVAFGPENLCIESSKIKEIVSKSLKSVGMENTEQRSISELSGGEKQKVAISGVLAMSESLLLLDEPTSMLDYESSASVMSILKKLNQEDGFTIVMVTQDMNQAFEADRIIILDNKTIALDVNRDVIIDHNIDLSCYNLELPKKILLTQYLKKHGFDNVEELKRLC